MIIIVCSLLAVAAVPAFGGDLRRMGRLPIRATWLVWIAIGTQTVLALMPATLPAAIAETVHLATYVLAGAFAIVNIRLPGVAVISFGGALNLLAIASNHGVMPASATALRSAGMAVHDGFSNSAFVAGARLGWLGDVFAVPAGWPFANVFSVGDVIIVVGVAWLAHRTCHSSDAVPTAVTIPPVVPSPAAPMPHWRHG